MLRRRPKAQARRDQCIIRPSIRGEPSRNASFLSGNARTTGRARLVPPLGPRSPKMMGRCVSPVTLRRLLQGGHADPEMTSLYDRRRRNDSRNILEPIPVGMAWIRAGTGPSVRSGLGEVPCRNGHERLNATGSNQSPQSPVYANYHNKCACRDLLLGPRTAKN
jgi:hypothetical protein